MQNYFITGTISRKVILCYSSDCEVFRNVWVRHSAALEGLTADPDLVQKHQKREEVVLI